MSDSRRVHLTYLDGIRGWAALFVVLHHVWQFVMLRPDIAHPPRWFSVMTVFKYGQYAVVVFIVLSGYCLMLPVARSAGSELAGGFRAFIERRARRILVPYYAALGLSLLLTAFIPRVAEPGDGPFELANIGAHALLVHNWFEPLQWTIDGPLWTVALEWQIYFVFALLLLPLWRRVGPLWTVVLAYVLGLLPMLAGYRFASPWFIGLFAVGMLAAWINFSRRESFGPRDAAGWEKWAMAFAASVVVLTALKLPALATPHPLIETLLGLATATFLIASTRRLQQLQAPNLLARAFEHPLSIKLGVFSYSVYLFHYPVLKALNLPIRDAQLPAVQSFALLVCVAVPLVMVAAYAFHLAFERPFMTEAAGSSRSESVVPPASERLDPAR